MKRMMALNTGRARTLARMARAAVLHRLGSASERLGLRPSRSLEPYGTHVPILIGLANIRPIKRVLELGAGTYSSRLFLDRRAFPNLEQLVSYENDSAWALQVRDIFDDDRATLKVVIGPIHNALADSQLDLGSFDLVLCDDSMDATARSATIRWVAEHLAHHAVLAVHDFEVPFYRHAAEVLPHSFVFDVFNPHTGVCWGRADVSLRQLQSVRLRIKAAKDVPAADIEAWVRLLGSSV